MSHYRATRKQRPTIEDLVYENSMEETIRQAASLFGWKRYHTYDSRRSPEGLPDDILCEYGQLIFWELKAEGEVPSDAQQGWLDVLSKVTGPPLVEVIHPGDLDRCLDILKRKGR